MISTEFLGDRCLASQACRGDSTVLSLASPVPAQDISIKLLNSFTLGQLEVVEVVGVP